MKTKNIDASVGATLYIKTKLLLHGCIDLSIKDMLKQMGLDVDKPFKVSIDKDKNPFCFWLKYECDNRKISFRFVEVVKKQDKKKILTIETLEDGVWERFGVFHNGSKANICKIFTEQRKNIYLSPNGEFVSFNGNEDENFEGYRISLEENMHAGVAGPYQVLLRPTIYSVSKKSGNIVEKKVLYLDFIISNWGKQSFYHLNNKSADKLKKFLKDLCCFYSNSPISILDIYQEICDIYGLQIVNVQKNCQVNLYVSDYNKHKYTLEEKNGIIEVHDNGIVSKYVRKITNGVVGLIRKRSCRS